MSEKPPLPGPAPEQEDPTRDDNPRIEGRGFHIELGQEPQTHDTRISLKPGANEADVVGEIRPKNVEVPSISVEPDKDDFEEDEPTQETEVPKEFRENEDWFKPDRDTIIAGGEESTYVASPKNHSSPPSMEMPRMPLVPKGSEEELEAADQELGEESPELAIAEAKRMSAKRDAIKSKGEELAQQMLRKHRADAHEARKELTRMKGEKMSAHEKVIDAALETLKGL